MELADKTAIVTGSSSGIGQAIALAREGAAVAVNYATDAEGAHSTVEEIERDGGRAFTQGADVSKPADVQTLIGETVRRFGRLDITVNNVAPGAIETPMDAALKEDPAQRNTLLSEIPLGRMGKPEEVASLAVYLASDAAAYITGSTLFVDGGMIRHSGSL